MRLVMSILFTLFVHNALGGSITTIDIPVRTLVRGEIRSEDGSPLAAGMVGCGRVLEGRFVLFVKPGVVKIPDVDGYHELEDCDIQSDLAMDLMEIGVYDLRRILSEQTETDSIDQSSEVYCFRYSGHGSLHQVSGQLLSHRVVLYFEPVYLLNIASSPTSPNDLAKSDPDLEDQWNLRDDYVGVECFEAWTHETGDPDVRIGIVEKGIDCSHPDLVNDFGDPIVVDGVLYDIDPETHEVTVDYSWPNCYDDGHGNAISGIAAAVRDNDTCIAGIAGGDGTRESGCRLVSVRIVIGFISDEVTDTALADAYTYSARPLSAGLGCRVLNNSYNFPRYSEKIRWGVRNVFNFGCNFVAVKNNTTAPPAATRVFPGDFDYSWVTCVGGYADDADLCQQNCGLKSSDYGYGLDILAPADDFPAITLNELCGDFGGNSGAAPHVSGAIGLLRSFLGNSYYPEDYEWLLKLTALDINDDYTDGDAATWEEWNGHGNLKIGSALSVVDNPDVSIHSWAATGGAISDSLYSSPVPYTFLKGKNLGVYDVQVYEIRTHVQFGVTYESPPYVWGLCHEVTGISAANPSYSSKFCSVVENTVDRSGCDIYTYLMKIKLFENMPPAWYPCAPNNVVMKCRAIGEVETRKFQNSDNRSDGSYSLAAHPNPFNTTVELRCPSSDQGTGVLEVYSLDGARVVTLYTESVAGVCRWLWDGRDSTGRLVSSGAYTAKAVVGNGKYVARLQLVK